MKKIIQAVFVGLIGLSSVTVAQDFYDMDQVREIRITFAESNWDEIMDNNHETGDGKTRLVGSCTIDGVPFDSVGVRFKGFSSYSPDNNKNPFNLKLDYIVGDQNVDGYTVLKLNSVYADPSFLRDALGYEISRKYMAAPKANFTTVYVNEVLQGLYTNVQSIDDFFTENHFYSKNRPFFKCNPENLVFPGGSNANLEYYPNEDSTFYEPLYKMQSNYGWSNLIELCRKLDEDPDNVEISLDVDRALWMHALNYVMVNLDGYIGFAQNYYLYEDETERFNSVIWDLNMSFGSYNIADGTTNNWQNLSVQDMQELDPYAHENTTNRKLMSTLFQNARYKKMYTAHMKTIVEEVLSNNWYQTRGQAIQSTIDTYVQADPVADYQDFLDNLTDAVGGFGFDPGTPGLVQLMEGRATYLLGLPEFQGEPTIVSQSYLPASPIAGEQITITAELMNEDEVFLGWRESKHSKFTRVPMFDDGAHDDGAAGDNVYGAYISSTPGELQYYIYGENAQGGKFSPVRAEYEFHTIEISGTVVPFKDLVINEVMASNASRNADANGTYEDWIEIYNKTASPISMSGMYLSDDVLNQTKWRFPDTTIAADDYIVVWADNEIYPNELHTNFKLSKTGESISLINYDSTLVDTMSYVGQFTDVSYGRFPNGTGDFTFMPSSHTSENNLNVSVVASGEIVINEFMADNISTQMDANGEFDDWIELYNTTSSDISLYCLKLSDESINPSKWMIPDVTIPANDYVIIWADNQSQDDIHANFKLAKTGDHISLSNLDESNIDSLSFTAQVSDVTTGRYVNGTGAFESMPPTFSSYNSSYNSGPILDINFISISNDDDNSSSMDAGETADINVNSLNLGVGASDEATITMTTPGNGAGFVTINTGTVVNGVIAASDFESATFNITADISTPLGTMVDVTFYLTDGTYSSTFDTVLQIGVPPTEVIMQDGQSMTCFSIFKDPGGDANYADNTEFTYTFYPAYADNKVQVEFTEFLIEMDNANCQYDYLEIFDGNNTSAPLIGQYCEDNNPGTILATNEIGSLTFHFFADQAVTESGWVANVSCVDFTGVENNEQEELLIYPNPSSGIVNVEVEGNFIINVYDLTGRLVLHQNNNSQLNLTSTESGVYFIEILKDGNKMIKKVVKE